MCCVSCVEPVGEPDERGGIGKRAVARVSRVILDVLPDLPNALCRYDGGANPDLWQPPYGTKHTVVRTMLAEAMEVCALCSERADCYEYASKSPVHMDGVWGGVDFTRTTQHG